MIKIRIEQDCINQDTKKKLKPGDEVEVSEFEAARLCVGGFAIPVVDNIRENGVVKKIEKRKRRNKQR